MMDRDADVVWSLRIERHKTGAVLPPVEEHWAVSRRSGVPRVCPSSGFTPNCRVLSLGAGEGIRTLDPDLGKVVLYP